MINQAHTWTRRLVHVGAASLALATMLYAGGLRFTLTPSVPIGLYVRVEEKADYGDVVVFCAPLRAGRLAVQRGYIGRGPCPGGAMPLGKYVLALPGDTITVARSALTYEGRPIPNSALHREDADGRLLPTLSPGEYVIGADSVFVFSGYHPRSFDSRYFGAVPQRHIQSVLRPVWTAK